MVKYEIKVWFLFSHDPKDFLFMNEVKEDHDEFNLRQRPSGTTASFASI